MILKTGLLLVIQYFQIVLLFCLGKSLQSTVYELQKNRQSVHADVIIH